VPNFDPANPSPWLASLRASRRRRAEAAQRARRKRAGRGGATALLASMTLIAGAAVAADGAGGTAPAAGTGGATLKSGAGGGTVVALQRALGIAASAPTKKAATGGGTAATLARIARCESGGNPAAVSRSGQYRGKYQFSRATWRAMGGKGDPAKAPESVQDALAAKLLAQRGTSPWPVCG
jgi:hypothetical protein